MPVPSADSRRHQARRVPPNGCPLDIGQLGIILRIAVGPPEHAKVHQADQAGDGKAPSPPCPQQQNA